MASFAICYFLFAIQQLATVDFPAGSLFKSPRLRSETDYPDRSWITGIRSDRNLKKLTGNSILSMNG